MTEFKQGLLNMKGDGSLNDEGATRIHTLYQSALDEIIGQLQIKIREWEELDPEDAKLYSLGLRHAVDILEGERDA